MIQGKSLNYQILLKEQSWKIWTNQRVSLKYFFHKYSSNFIKQLFFVNNPHKKAPQRYLVFSSSCEGELKRKINLKNLFQYYLKILPRSIFFTRHASDPFKKSVKMVNIDLNSIFLVGGEFHTCLNGGMSSLAQDII